MKTYPIRDRVPDVDWGEQDQWRAALTGEFRPPKKFEWYLSGAIPEAYQALDDLDQSYHILRIMKMERKITWVPMR